jgi:hypothetical protein
MLVRNLNWSIVASVRLAMEKRRSPNQEQETKQK